MEPEVSPKTDCFICLNNEINITLTKLNCRKMLTNCEAHLDTSIITKSFKDEAHDVSCCGYCYECVCQLTKLGEQVQQLQKEISDLGSLFSKNVLERRSRFKNEKDVTTKTSTHSNKLFPKNSDSHSISMAQTVSLKKEVTECDGSEELPSDHPVKTERDDLSKDMWVDEDDYSSVHQNECENVFDSEKAIDIKYSYDETILKVVDTVNKQIEQLQRVPSTNGHLEQQARRSVEELLKTVKMPLIQLKRLQPGGSRHSPKNRLPGKGRMKCQNGLDASNQPENNCDVERFKCPKISCSKSFKTAFNLKRHIRIHIGGQGFQFSTIHSEEKPFKCSLCFKSFKNSSNWCKHKTTHSKERPHQCSVCAKSFQRLHHLKDHEKIHSGEKPYGCSFCSKAFAFARTLKQHEIIHSGEKPYQCSFCSKSFAWEHGLKNHEKRHRRETSYKCSFCTKLFFTPTDVKLHEKIHTIAERPYKCSFCEKPFKSQYEVIRHERVHTGERPYKCPFCEKSFKNENDRKVHERIHSGERPYKCPCCEKAYKQKYKLTLHERKQHEKRTHVEEFILP